MQGKEIQNLIIQTQERWASVVLAISEAYKNKSNLENLVSELLNDIYAFNHCDVLFQGMTENVTKTKDLQLKIGNPSGLKTIK